jgi:hypothetical protein
MDAETAKRLTDFVMMVGLLRRDMKAPQVDTFKHHEGRIARVEQKLSDLAELISRDDPDLAKALHKAFLQPAATLAFKNAEHQKALKRQAADDGDPGSR